MKAIILAAGVNKRLQHKIDYPKSLLKIGKKTILETQIAALKSAGLKTKDILVVVGYKKEMIEKYHKNTVYNKDYKKYDNARSVYLGLQQTRREEVLILDGDLIVDKKIIKNIISNKNKNVMLGKEVRDELLFTYDDNILEYMAIPCKTHKVFSYGGIVKLSKGNAYLLKLNLQHKTKWYTSQLVDMKGANDFYVLNVDKNYKCFDIDTEEDIKKLK